MHISHAPSAPWSCAGAHDRQYAPIGNYLELVLGLLQDTHVGSLMCANFLERSKDLETFFFGLRGQKVGQFLVIFFCHPPKTVTPLFTT